MTRKLRQKSAGFTLIELLITVAIASVLLVVAAPSFTAFVRNSELTSRTNTLLSALNAARSEAMKTGYNALVVPSAGGNDWGGGWTVFVDLNRNNAYDAAVDRLVMRQDAFESYFTITGTNNAALSTAYVMFDNSGYAKSYGSTPGAANLTLKISRTDVPTAAADEQSRIIVVARTGRVRSCKPASDSSCTTTATQ